MEQALPLRDIHLPETISWWPPAIGWWLLLLLIPLFFFLLLRLYQHFSRHTVIKSAEKILASIQQDPDSTDQQKLIQLSSLLRRIAISTGPRSECAGLNGTAWLQYLDRSVQGKPFSQGPGHHLGDALFQKSVPDDLDIDALIELCRHWLRAQQ